jgi:hypothetical protein
VREGVIDNAKKLWLDLCITSWAQSGHEWFTVNLAHEAQILRDIYPNINVHETKRSALEICNRPLVFISDAIQIALKLKADRYAICNSDVLIASSVPSIKSGDNSCYYSSRLDIGDITSSIGTPFNGIDYFSFHSSFATEITSRFFAFGLPWWDYWLPVQAIRSKRKLFRLTNLLGEPILLHKKHPDVWSSKDFVSMGNHFLEFLANDSEYTDDLTAFTLKCEKNLDLSNDNIRIFSAIAKTVCVQIHESAQLLSN